MDILEMPSLLYTMVMEVGLGFRNERRRPHLMLRPGSSIAKYAGKHVAERLASESAYNEGDYATALKRAFLGTDDDLRAGEKESTRSAFPLTFHPDPAFFHDPSGCTAVAALITTDRKLYVVRKSSHLYSSTHLTANRQMQETHDLS
jgi:hypothetical protein